MDNKIDEIYKSIITTEGNSPSEVHEEEINEEHLSNVIQLTRVETSDSSLDLAEFIPNKQYVPEKFREVTDKDILDKLAIELIQRHIRAVWDRVAINDSKYSRFRSLIVWANFRRFQYFSNHSVLIEKTNRENIISGKYVPPSKENFLSKIVTIQRYWRNYRTRRQMKIKTRKRNILIGKVM